MKKSDYLEIFDPLRRLYFPVRIVDFHQDGIICYFLNTKSTKKIYQYSLDNYGYKKPWISDELLINSGLNEDNLKFFNKDKIVIKCLVGELKATEYPFFAEFSSNFFAYKFLNSEEEAEKFIDVLKNTSVDKDNKEFKEEFQTTSRVEDLRDFLNFEIESFDEIYLKSRSAV